MHTTKVAALYRELQQEVLEILEAADGKARFVQDAWTKDIGSGLTCVMQNGNIIEKAGVNFSQVEGPYSDQMARLLGEGKDAKRYAATGISSILHAGNPFVPTIHMNVRHFSLDDGTEWFGGGIDLTPTYVNVDEARAFHLELKSICDRYDSRFYPDWKAWADDYFYLPHRNETRGVGGIFFDRIKPGQDIDFESMLQLTADLTRAYPRIYSRLMKANGSRTYTAEQKQWQKIRRGRYVEYNLIYDRGTKFGLESGGNTESILVSLPAEVEFHYKHQPIPGSPEAQSLSWLRKGLDWTAESSIKTQD
ncbi:oxygen-dependent coproporphyrinogen oxidase [Roseimarinus sediminis]|uniref:oxygen-dependent coproporphyrinogen oxidase n=1 Tax=Roseimarinus sediminis TaxID=1610899 RepID=UPI003D1A4461